MRESKGDLTSRLRRESRWEEFVARREALKCGGMPASEAWTQAAAEFPAPATESADRAATQGDLSGYDLSVLAGKPQLPMGKAVMWAFENLDSPSVTPADAPSAGAWSMLTWARMSKETRSEFMRNFVAKLMPSKQAVEEFERMTDDGSDVLEALEVCRQAAIDSQANRLNRERSIARAVLQDELCPACLAAAQAKGIATVRQTEDFWRA